MCNLSIHQQSRYHQPAERLANSQSHTNLSQPISPEIPCSSSSRTQAQIPDNREHHLCCHTRRAKRAKPIALAHCQTRPPLQIQVHIPLHSTLCTESPMCQ